MVEAVGRYVGTTAEMGSATRGVYVERMMCLFCWRRARVCGPAARESEHASAFFRTLEAQPNGAP